MAETTEDKLCVLLKSAFPHDTDINRIKVCRKTKHLHQGDFFVPKGVLNIDLNTETERKAHLEAAVRQATSGDLLPVASLSCHPHASLTFHLDRQAACRNIIRTVLSEGEAYGRWEEGGARGVVVVNPADVQSWGGGEEGEGEPQAGEGVSLTQLRAVVLLKHLLRLLEAHGYQAQVAQFPQTDDVRDLLRVFNIDAGVCERSVVEEAAQRLTLQAQRSPHQEAGRPPEGDQAQRSPHQEARRPPEGDQAQRSPHQEARRPPEGDQAQRSPHQEGDQRLTLQAQRSPHQEAGRPPEGDQAQRSPHQEAGRPPEGDLTPAPDTSRDRRLGLSLRTFLTTSGLRVGRAGYDRNLNLLDVRLEDGALSDTVRKAAMMEILASQHQAATVCVHLVSQSAAYTQQQADLLWRMCTRHDTARLIQQHLVFGAVSGRKSSASAVMDAREFYNMRHRQMTQAAMMKYGDHDQGGAWDDMVDSLTVASVTFDLLTSACPSQAHVDLSEEEGDNRCGSFVLYNTARLASLLTAFQQQVEQGTYPPLPDPQHINFQLLREEEEWSLALLYLHAYPRVVRDALHGWSRQDGIRADADTHRISNFLLNFSKTLSSYYSRYHILGGSEGHLLPLMFARLSLMKAAHTVLCNGLQLLGLRPLTHL